MKLKLIVEELYIDSKKTPIRGLSAIAEAEKYLQQAYEGRYFFELIQNVRDANKELDQDGEIFIELGNRFLTVSNTGAEFSVKGIEGITTIGQSTKQSQDFIGFKGIGFKSIQEVTNTPGIRTQHGTISFDRNLTLQEYNDETLKVEQIPLFYFPHFHESKLSEAELNKKIVTKVELPLKQNVSEKKIIDDFKKIQAKQIVLLGNIKYLELNSELENVKFSIEKISEKHYIEVRKNDEEIYRFRNYSPINKIKIPSEVIDSLEGKEKELFLNSNEIDVSIVLELNENNQVSPINDAKLYLFYPLQIASGFRFIIHSYFIVNPERTALRDSPLNSFLLKAIGKFISTEMLRTLKGNRSNTGKILAFQRNPDARLDDLYNSVVDNLKTQRFIYDGLTKKYFLSSEVIVADGFDKGLFTDNRLAGKQLIYTDDKLLITWLNKEFDVPYLTYDQISKEIEAECSRQLKRKKINFFQNLYNYAGQHHELNLIEKKVLLTDQWQLVSSIEDVFYGGGKGDPINLAPSIKKYIHFIHRDIKISDFREGRSQTGIVEFSTFELVKRLVKLFAEENVPKIDILNALFNLELDSKSEIEVKEKILLPIIGSNKWLSPITNPIYFYSEPLKELYPNGKFINEDLLVANATNKNLNKKIFLKRFGVWNIPAVYIVSKTVITSLDKRESKLFNLSNLYSRPFYIVNDRILDKPVKFNSWFTNTIIENWGIYRSFILSDLLPKMQYYSASSYSKTIWNKEAFIELSGFIETLKTEKWIAFSGEENSYSVKEIIGIDSIDFHQPHNQVLKRYLKLFPINYFLKKELIVAIEMNHLDGDSTGNYVLLLRLIYHQYKNRIPDTKDFIDCYHRILNKLFEYYYFKKMQADNISVLANEYFLAVNEIKKTNSWSKAREIFYIDDKPNYDLLPLEIKLQVQPQFTLRDRNTFGKIAAKIGRKFSESIKRELVEQAPTQTNLLVTYLDELPDCMAILESSLDVVLNKELTVLRRVKVIEKERIVVRIIIGNAEAKEVEVDHFVDVNYDIHLSTYFFKNKNKLIAGSLTDLFVKLLDRDLRKFNLDLLRYLNTQNKDEYLRDYEISEERIREIKEKLNSSDLTLAQKFWNAILLARDISSRENIFIGKEINTNNLAGSLAITPANIQDFTDQFNFNDTNNISNIDCLVALLKALELPLLKLNFFLFPKIDFREYYNKQLLQLKNKFQKGFEALLHNLLKSLTRQEMETYQTTIDNYKHFFEFSVSVDLIGVDITEYFFKEINKKYNKIKFSKDDLVRSFDQFKPKKIYKEQFRLLTLSLESIKYSEEQLDIFLSDNKRRSLLYFNQTEYLANAFKNWLIKNSEKSVTENDHDIEALLKEFSNSTSADIEAISINSVELPKGKSGNKRASGNRFDGEALNENKKIIGLVAEMIVFEKLNTKFKEVIWVSKNASKIFKEHPGYNPEGDDSLGYDIEYLDLNGNKYFVEVKGKTDSFSSFEISASEVEQAYKTKDFYKVIFVTDTLNNSQRKIKDLGNIFMLNKGEDFFSNNKFSVIFKNFEIRFQ